MSYILDALRKSEEKRSSLSLPAATGHHHQAQIAKDHRIQWLLIALFIAVGGGWFMTRSLQPETMPVSASHSLSAEPEMTVAETAMRKPQPAPQTPDLDEQPEQTLRMQKAHTQQTKTDSDHVAPAMPEQKTAPPDSVKREITSIPPSLLTDDHEPALADAHIPSRAELTLNQQKALPAVSIAGHIYDVNPSGRMVIINDKLRREKQRIGDGLTLEEITADGVILMHRGIIFRMGVFD